MLLTNTTDLQMKKIDLEHRKRHLAVPNNDQYEKQK